MDNIETAKLVYDFIAAFIEREGYAPSLREIGAGCYLSLGNVVRYLDKLEAWGLVTREPGKPRSIHLLERQPHW